jgi:hypothetical protein
VGKTTRHIKHTRQGPHRHGRPVGLIFPRSNLLMNGSNNRAILVALLVTTLGVWGCTQSRGSPSAARVRDVEARNAKLEEDYRAAVAEGAALQKRLTAAEKVAAQVRSVQQERDRFRQQVTATQNERNALQAQMQQFGRELQTLMGKVDAAVGTGPQPVTTAAGGGSL